MASKKKTTSRGKAKQKAVSGKAAQARKGIELASKKSKQEFAKARKKLADTEKKVASMIKKNPKAAMGVIAAVGAGVAAGLAFALKKKKK